ncbi:uncharacterized protein A4U43_C06F3460 [Asparagus officinalis]|uniref:Uncharacterized protein n=1 Tax=Asparagus officinalis TaxID=4686 RepID=A0A5P1EN89_ASPOF|nr:uncharacterized protein A4U43_C06F3460 [Asparagus officinalis]
MQGGWCEGEDRWCAIEGECGGRGEVVRKSGEWDDSSQWGIRRGRVVVMSVFGHCCWRGAGDEIRSNRVAISPTGRCLFGGISSAGRWNRGLVYDYCGELSYFLWHLNYSGMNIGRLLTSADCSGAKRRAWNDYRMSAGCSSLELVIGGNEGRIRKTVDDVGRGRAVYRAEVDAKGSKVRWSLQVGFRGRAEVDAFW